MSRNHNPTRARKAGGASRTARGPFWNEFEKMTDAQKDRYVRQYEREISPAECEPPTAREARRHAAAMEKVKRPPGRPKLGGVGAKSVLITIDPALLARADAWAKERGVSRSALFARAVELAIRSGRAGGAS